MVFRYHAVSMTNQIPISDFGFPIMSGDEIETKAEEVIEFFGASAILDKPQFTPITTFVDQTKNKFGIGFEIQDLGHTKSGAKILGAFQLNKLAIYLDATVVGTSRHAFTLAHEFGHLVLHRNLRVPEDGYVSRDTEYDLVTGKKKIKSTSDWVEWQANRFAAAILMPRQTVRKALIEIQREMGIAKNIGLVFLDNQPVNIQDYIKIQLRLCQLYQVNKTNIEYRLSDLGCLIDHRDFDTIHISQLLQTV